MQQKLIGVTLALVGTIYANTLWGQTQPEGNGIGHEYRTMILPRPSFTESSLAQLCRALPVKQNTFFVNIWFFPSKEEESDFWMGKLGNDTAYDTWRVAYNKAVSSRMPIAEFVRIAGDSVLLLRRADGTASRQVLSGEDPLTLVRSGAKVELLHFTVTPFHSQSGESRLLVYGQTAGPLTSDLGRVVLTELRRRLPFSDVILSLRLDPWFIGDSAFPVLPAFWPQFPAPTREEYVRSPTLVCVMRSPDDARCTFQSHQR